MCKIDTGVEVTILDRLARTVGALVESLVVLVIELHSLVAHITGHSHEP